MEALGLGVVAVLDVCKKKQIGCHIHEAPHRVVEDGFVALLQGEGGGGQAFNRKRIKGLIQMFARGVAG